MKCISGVIFILKKSFIQIFLLRVNCISSKITDLSYKDENVKHNIYIKVYANYLVWFLFLGSETRDDHNINNVDN